MDSKFARIRILIWDIDGTFYKMIPEIKRQYREREIAVIMNHTGWLHEQANTAFYSLYPSLKSGTQTAAKLSGITTKAAAIEAETYIDRTSYITRDIQLIDLFQKLNTFTHYLLVNGIRRKTVETLTHLGLKENQFQEIVTAEIVGETKPNPAGFTYIMQKTGSAPEEHLMIGDREEVDIVPAKKLGMKTCLVWSDTKSQIADVTLSTVYEVASLFL